METRVVVQRGLNDTTDFLNLVLVSLIHSTWVWSCSSSILMIESRMGQIPRWNFERAALSRRRDLHRCRAPIDLWPGICSWKRPTWSGK